MVEIRKRAAGVVVVRKSDERWLFLLLRAYRNWEFPKGLIEPGEDALAAAIRETLEETTIQDLEFCWGTGFIETEPYAGGKVARYYVAKTAQSDLVLPISPALRRPEHHEYRWILFGPARELLHPRLQRVLDWAKNKVEPIDP
jgi:8-oxo-dGTP pyrophosphatase MutT (NUDIX family)